MCDDNGPGRSYHKVPDGQTDYLAKAGDLLDKASEENERRQYPLDTTRERLARQYTVLAAIQRGILPAEMAKELFDNVDGKARS